MTAQMIIALVIVIGMIVAIMSDKFSFGAPPLVACILMVLCGVSTVSEAFAGFVDTNVIMIAGFMAVMSALQKTSLMSTIRGIMAKLATKGGFVAYVAIILIVMLGAGLMSGSTGYYVMVLAILTSIPYSKKLPNSKLVMPAGFATGRALIPVGVAFFMGMAGSLLESSGYTGANITLGKFMIMVFFMSLGFFIWCLLGYKLLPDHDVQAGEGTEKVEEKKVELLPQNKQIIVYVAFIVSVVGMFFSGHLGEAAYVLPGLATAALVLFGVMDFKEARNQLFSPLILMMASVIGVAGALASTGFTAMVGEKVATLLGGSVSPFILTLAFCYLTSIAATLTGASIGSLFVFAPIGIATFMSLGYNPVGLACAMTVSAWGGGFLPIDGLPAMILGLGKYKLTDFEKFAVPMYLIQILFLVIGASIAFPA